MLPTKGYFHDIECPYYDSSCDRPYCHFRHRKKPTENTDEILNDNEKKDVPLVPTYKPTPKSELANIHNNKSHIPISYVPDLAFRPDRIKRPLPKFENPTYKPTPLSILSSANNSASCIEQAENSENIDVIEEIKQNIANVEYKPTVPQQSVPDINFDELSTEFEFIDTIISERNLNELNQTKSDDINETHNPKCESSKSVKNKSEKKSNNDKSTKKDKTIRHGEKGSHEKTSKTKELEKEKSSSRSHKHSREKHRKEEKKASKDKHSHKSSHRSKEKDEKYKDKGRNKEKEKSSHHSKNKHKEKVKEQRKDKDTKKSDKKVSSESEDSPENELAFFDSTEHDFDLDDDHSDTMMECYKIFSEYKPEIKRTDEAQQSITESDNSEKITAGKKRIAHTNAENVQSNSKINNITKPKALHTPGQIMANRFKLARIAQANKEQDSIINEVKQVTSVKRSAPTLLEAARQHKIKKSLTQNTQQSKSVNLIDEILNSSSKSVVTPRKIAPVKNVFSIQKAKERIEEMTKKKGELVVNKTIAQTQKGSRVAHVPEISLSDIPDVLHVDKSKLPVNVRTRYLTMLADECVKLYLSKEDAFTRALNEEFTCYEKCKVLATYRNSAMLAVNRLRKEIQERQKLGLDLIGSGESSSLDKGSEFKGRKFYNNVKRWVLSEEELDIHGYPRESEEPGKAVIKNRKVSTQSTLEENQRKCSRCSKMYVVDLDGFPVYEEECMYHPLKKRTIRGEQTFLCCKSGDDTGCATSDTHVSEFSETGALEGFQTTMEPERDDDPKNFAVFALDCEMCYTTRGLELTRVTIVDIDCKTVYESLVKPLNPIIDYNTRFSGITKEQLDKTSTNILQVQANILHLCNSRTILVGHSLESDMKALKIVHGSVIDTSVLFPHKMGLPHKRALRMLASEYLNKIIQNDVSGHDSAEDAITCMELIKWKLKEELKTRGSKTANLLQSGK